MYEMDRYTIEELGLDSKILMENAGRAISQRITKLITKKNQILVLIGSGNNGGDGFVIARTLHHQGYQVLALQLVADYKIQGDAAYHKQLFINFGGMLKKVSKTGELKGYLEQASIVVDAILGLGVKGKLRSPLDEMVALVNSYDVITVAVDLPSGIPADEGITDFVGIEADYTFIIQELKPSAVLGHTAPYYGKWEVVDIGISTKTTDFKQVWSKAEVCSSLPRRNDYAHKGNHGRGLVIGGSRDMPGSVAMTALAALRAGSGLITVASAWDAIPIIANHCMEAMYTSLQSENGKIINDQRLDLTKYDAIAIGMGMGREPKTTEFVQHVVANATVPILIDADGLYHVKGELPLLAKRKYRTVLTPHIGEMAMLSDTTSDYVLANPFEIAKQFATLYNVYLVLKSAVTIITAPSGKQWVNMTGNSGLAKGGSGDVLSGVLLAMMMQPQSVQEALSNGCYIHGTSADILVAENEAKQSLLASDVINGLTRVFRAFQ